eukprot:15366909-Ditylum_brightwellii.AAC.1
MQCHCCISVLRFMMNSAFSKEALRSIFLRDGCMVSDKYFDVFYQDANSWRQLLIGKKLRGAYFALLQHNTTVCTAEQAIFIMDIPATLEGVISTGRMWKILPTGQQV